MCNKTDNSCRDEKLTCKGCAYCEKSADEMFFNLGYIRKHIDGNYNIDFYKYETALCKDDTLNIIRFYADTKEIWANKILTMQELQAINKKVQELGWLDVK